jgi:UDP-N-acetylglucosamine acyltransferase
VEVPVPDVHPTAIVDAEATLADDVVIGPFSVIGPRVTLGPGTRVGTHVLIEGHTTLGAGNQVFHGAALGSAPQDFGYRGEESYVRIGDHNVIREYVTIQPATESGGETRIGNHNLLMAYVHVAHNCRIDDRTILANSVNLAGFVHVGDYVVVGGVTPIHQFVRIGPHAMVGGGSRVSQDVAPYMKSMAALKQAHRIFFRSKLPVAEATRRIEEEVPDLPEVRRFVAFVSAQGRGITR